MLEDVRCRETDAEVPLDRDRHLDDEEGMATKLEEVVGEADARAFEQALPERDQRLLRFRWNP